jgi:predicted metal-dependent hydrolase
MSADTASPEPSLDPAEDLRYAAFFDIFNAGRHHESHDALEPLWLEVRGKPEADFYKGLIQLAGAFVHVRKGRTGPALALLDLALRRLAPYPDLQAGLDLRQLREQVAAWRARVAGGQANAAWLNDPDRPQLSRPSVSP